MPAINPNQPQGGPGTELKALLKRIYLLPKNCGCEARAQQMNRWGVEGCRLKRAEIIAWLEMEKSRTGWLEYLEAGLGVLKDPELRARISVRDPVPDLVDLAIELAEQKQKAP